MLFNRPDQQFHVIAFDANGRVSGEEENITATLKIDDGTRVALNDVNPTEIGTTGEYVFDLLQAETNGYALSFVPVVASAGVEILGMPSNVIYTTQPGLVGNFTRTITVIDAATSLPIPMARVRLYTDSETETKETDGDGEATFATAVGTYNYVVRVSGYSGATGTIVVAGDGTTEIALNAFAVPTPADPNTAVLRVICVGEDSEIDPGAVVLIRMIDAPSDQVGFGYGGGQASFTADANGIAERLVIRGATYEVRREGTYKQWQKYVMPTDEALIEITSFVQP